MLFCPSDITMKSSESSVKVTWDEPRYSDNCGNYSECKIDIYTATPSGSNFAKDTPTRVSYTATDPSNNVNEECIFNVLVKGKQNLNRKCPISFAKTMKQSLKSEFVTVHPLELWT